MKTNRLLFVFFLFICISAKGQMRQEGRDLVLHEISFSKKFVRSFMNDSIQDMTKQFGMNNEKDVLCVYFRKETDTILFWPRSLQYGITEWFLYWHIDHIIGYYKKDDVRVLVLCEDLKKYKGYFKVKNKSITLHVKAYAPTNETEFVYKKYTIRSNKSMILTKENIPNRKVFFY